MTRRSALVMGVWCMDTRGSKMLDGEVRFGNDWEDQVTHISSRGKLL